MAQEGESTMDQRRSALVELVNREGSVSFSQIKQAFPNVSEMTLRTDLKTLDQERLIIRVHGGARSVENLVGSDGMLNARALKHADAKRAIALKARELVRPDTTIFLDSGSTTTELARLFPDEHVIVFTCGLTCAVELARLEQAQVILPGGKLNRFSLSASGSRSIRAVSELTFDTLFLGTTRYSADTGFTCESDEEADLKKTCMARASKVVMLMDSSKVDKRGTFRICGLEDIDVLVSDGELPRDMLQRCADNNVEVL